MTENDIQLLKAKIDNGAIIIRFIDGEKVTAKILSVSESEQDVIFDVVSAIVRNLLMHKVHVWLILMR